MSFLDDYAYTEPDPSKTILTDQQPNNEAAKAQLAAQLAQRIAQEEDQSGVRSPLRDMFNENGEVGLADAQQAPPPPPDSQPLRITITPGPITNVPMGGSAGGVGGVVGQPTDLTQDQATPPNLVGTIPSLAGSFEPPDQAPPPLPSAPPDLTQYNEPQPQPVQASGSAAAVLPPPTVMDRVDQATRGVRQMARGVLSTSGALPYQLGAGVAAIPGAISELVGLPAPPSNDLVQYLLGRAENSRRFAENVTGLSGDKAEPQNAVEAVAKLIGENVTPIKGATLPATLIASTVTGLLGPAAAKEASDKAAAKERMREAATQEIIETVGGPAKVDKKELYTLGGLALVTMGMMFVPGTLRRFKMNTLPKFRPVEDAAAGTQAISNNIDRARTADDANAGVLRLARRAGVDPVTHKDLQQRFNVETRSNAHALVDSAIMTGRMESPNFQFRAPTSLANLARKETPQVRDYLNLHDAFDELMLVHNSPKAMRGLSGPPTIRGMDYQHILSAIGALEAINPALKQIGKEYAGQLKAVRDFAGNGEFATISKSELQHLNAERSHQTQFRGPSDDPNVNLGSPTDNLATKMHQTLRHRMENEAKGQYIDALRARDPRLAVPVSHKDLQRNWKWKRNVVEIYRRGQLERYTTDPFIADVLRMDPYFMFGGLADKGVYSLRRMLETTTTGRWAPWFAPTSAFRNMLIGRYTAPPGMRPPTMSGTLYAIPQQLLPKMAQAISRSMSEGSMQWLDNVFGHTAVNNMSVRLANEYSKSIIAQLEAAGTSRASILETQTQAITKLQHASNLATGTAKGMLNGYEEMLHAVHNAPMHNFVSRNRQGATISDRISNVGRRAVGLKPTQRRTTPLPELAAEARHLVGSPRVSGAYWASAPSGVGKPHAIRVEGTNRVSHTIASGYAKSQQFLTEFAPWHNVTVQGMKRIMEAYVENPARFVGRVWLYSQMPAASLYYFTRSLGDDPNGVSYRDYMMNRRSDYAKQMFMYIPIPGRPAEDGIEVPNFHELAPMYRLMQVALDHATNSSIFTEKEDFAKAAQSFFNVAIEPPLPPILTAPMAAMGVTPPMGFLGAEVYKRKVDPFDQTGGLPASLDMLARATAGGVADVVGKGYAAFVQTPEGLGAASANAMKDMGKRIIEKTPFVRDVMNIHPSLTGNTPIVEGLFEKQRAVDNLMRFYQNYGVTGVRKINLKPASQAGGKVADLLVGENVPSTNMGIDQPMPTNPLYLEFIETLHDQMKKDDPATGGMGIRSLWRKYGDIQAHLGRMRNVNSGNHVTWQKQLSESPDLLKYMSEYKINKDNPQDVRNFLERKRQDVARTILFAIRSVEAKMSKEKGVPIKIENLDPYGKGKVVGEDTGLLPDPIMEMQMGPQP